MNLPLGTVLCWLGKLVTELVVLVVLICLWMKFLNFSNGNACLGGITLFEDLTDGIVAVNLEWRYCNCRFFVMSSMVVVNFVRRGCDDAEKIGRGGACC
jgi:hypothetical protein